MIFGIGTDIVKVARMQRNIDQFGIAFARKLLTDKEMQAYAETTKPAHFLAKRFAAKEAVVKAFGTGFRDGLSLRSISVGHNELGCPKFAFHGQGKVFCERHQIDQAHLSLADEEDYAIAYVVLVTANTRHNSHGNDSVL